MQLLLASSSPYRRALLARLGVEFGHCAPAIDESPQPEETAQALVRRLAEAKARTAATRHPKHLILGSDQAAADGLEIINKPGSPSQAHEQLARLSGRRVTFFTGLCVFDPATDTAATDVVATEVVYRQLSEVDIARYLAREPAHDCAGSVKVEGLGILLFDAINSSDPTALIGLPIIRLRQLLAGFGYDLFNPENGGSTD